MSSIWTTKPWWCQPWSILLTGVVVVSGCWSLLPLRWLNALVTAAVLLWWFLFLVLVPSAYRAEVSERSAMGDDNGQPL